MWPEPDLKAKIVPPYDVFISHSTTEKLTANAICNELESAGSGVGFCLGTSAVR